MTKVAVFMGSISDEEKMRPCVQVLDELGIEHFFTVTSAHRTPERTAKLVADLEKKGCQVYICAAGMAAHLAGAVAAKTARPVIGVPLSALGAFVFHLPVYWVAVCVMSEEVTKWFLGVTRYRSRRWINNLAHIGDAPI
jgi:hypothetical protein